MVERWSSKPFAWVRFLLPLLYMLLKSYKKNYSLNYKKTKKLTLLRGIILKKNITNHFNKLVNLELREPRQLLYLKKYNTRRVITKSLYKHIGYAKFKKIRNLTNFNNFLKLRKFTYIYFNSYKKSFLYKKIKLNYTNTSVYLSTTLNSPTLMNLSSLNNFEENCGSVKLKNLSTPSAFIFKDVASYNYSIFNTYGYDYAYYFTYRREYKLQFPFSVRYVMTAVNFSDPDPQKI